MKLVIISNMAHYRRSNGVIVGHGATARELDVLATLFDEVRHVACLHDGPPPASALPYAARNLALVAVPPAGGDDLASKLDIVRLTPLYTRTILRELRDADAVHVRAPANITLYAIVLLALRAMPRPRWIKYAGDWRPTGREPRSYWLQRKLLEGTTHRAQVSINGRYAEQPPHVHSFDNPCLTDEELERGRRAAEGKQLTSPVRLLFVGHFGAAKNPRVAIEIVEALREDGIAVHLDLAGDGPERSELEAQVARANIGSHVTFHGAMPRPELAALYDAAHFVVLPSRTEGWPKVLGEGMASGAVPLATAVGSIPEMLGEIGAGRAIRAPEVGLFVGAIRDYLTDTGAWARESSRAVAAANRFGYARYRIRIRELLF